MTRGPPHKMENKRQHGTMTFEEVTFEKIHAKIKEERYDNMKNIFEKGVRAPKKSLEKKIRQSMKQEIMDCSKDTRTKKTAAIAYTNKWWKQKLGRN